MLCEEAKSALATEYLDKTDARHSDELSRHLITCRNCRGHTARLNNILKTMQWERMETPGRDFTAELVTDLKSRRKAGKKSPSRIKYLFCASACLIPICLGLAGVPWFYTASPRAPDTRTGNSLAPRESARQKTERLIFGGKNLFAEFLPFPELAVADAADREKAKITALLKAPPEKADCRHHDNTVNFTARFKTIAGITSVDDGQNDMTTLTNSAEPAHLDLATSNIALVKSATVTALASADSTPPSRGVIYSPDMLDLLTEFSPATPGTIISANLSLDGSHTLSGVIGNFTAGLRDFASAVSPMGTRGAIFGDSTAGPVAFADDGGVNSRDHNSSVMMAEEVDDFVSVNVATETPPTWGSGACRMSGS